MAGEVYVPKRLEERGVKIAVPIEDPEVWQRRVEADPALPKSYGELLRGLVERHFPRRGYTVSSADAEEPPLVDRTCGENLYARIYGGLANPELAAEERDSIEAVLAEAVPTDWKTKPFTHFLLRWTETDPDPANNLESEHAQELIDEAGALLEQAWQSLTTAFGRVPFGSEGSNKIQVDFQDLPNGVQGLADTLGPIVFDAREWQASEALRAPLAAHELFHKMQYAFGFRLDWAQTATDTAWFSEGTARWAEVFVHQRLTAAKWLTDWMADPTLDLFAMSSFALPFWLFFDARLRSTNHTALLDLLDQCETEKDAQQGLDKALSLSNQMLVEFFTLFAAESFLGESRRMPNGQILFPQILGPDDQPVEPRPQTKTVILGPGQIFPSSVPESILLEAFGSSYYAFNFAPEADGRPFRLEVQAAEDLSHQVILQRAGSKVEQLPPVIGNFVHTSTIQLAVADTLVLVTSGRGVPTQAEISAQVG